MTSERWQDFELLFGPRGACGGCWCMWWLLPRAEFQVGKGKANRVAFKGIVDSGGNPGLLAYRENEPAGWCAVAAREQYARLQRSRILKPVDHKTVWSIVCFFIARKHRRTGVTAALIEAAKDFVAARGGHILEAYPVDPQKDNMPTVFAWTGFRQAFERAGFVEVLRRSPTRPIMRFELSRES